MKVLVNGFAGTRLADFLLNVSDARVYGIEGWRSRTENREHIKEKLELMDCDIRDSSLSEEADRLIFGDQVKEAKVEVDKAEEGLLNFKKKLIYLRHVSELIIY